MADSEVPAHRAFADESCEEATGGGIYVLAAVTFPPARGDEVTEAMRELRGRRRVAKLHWNEMERAERRAAAKRVASLEGLHVVAVGSPVPRRRQERARAACLKRLVWELHGSEMDELYMEARTRALDTRDVRTVTGARYLLPKGTSFRVEHQPGAVQPLFWAADIVAGAVRAARLGDGWYREPLADCVYEVDVDTRL
ncbi:MAG: DUF3800 domain-containing protein [Streptosporangiales bacterium]